MREIDPHVGHLEIIMPAPLGLFELKTHMKIAGSINVRFFHRFNLAMRNLTLHLGKRELASWSVTGLKEELEDIIDEFINVMEDDRWALTVPEDGHVENPVSGEWENATNQQVFARVLYDGQPYRDTTPPIQQHPGFALETEFFIHATLI